MQKLTFWNENELKEFLDKNWIDTSKYWKWEAKTIKNLYNEVSQSEAKLYISKDTKQVIREIKVLSLNILYKDLKLNESQQVFKEDWVETSRKRERNLTASMGEKINDWEDKHLAIFRAIHEELWIILNEEQINKLSLIETNETRVSQSFPDIQTEYKFYTTDIILNENQYDPFWYIENQEDKNVYFNWKQKS